MSSIFIQLRYVIIFSLFATAACGQNNDDHAIFLGSWKHVAEGGVVECPDVVRFFADGTYDVLNDCYGEDRAVPVTEKGAWKYDEADEIIEFRSRRIFGNYYFRGKKGALFAKLKTTSFTKMTLCFAGAVNCVEETYKKVSEE